MPQITFKYKSTQQQLMKKTYNLLSACLLLLVGLFAAAMPAKAQLSFAEDFNYPSGTLTEQSGGKWFTYYSYYKEYAFDVCY